MGRSTCPVTLVLAVCAERLYEVLCLKVVAECALKGLAELCQPRSDEEKAGRKLLRLSLVFSRFVSSLQKVQEQL